MTSPETIDEQLLAEYGKKLAAIRYESVGFVETLILSPRPDEHLQVNTLQVIPEVGVEGQYPGKQWWKGKRVPGRQISAVSADILDVLEIAHDAPGDNLIVRGLDLAQFAPGDTLRIGDAIFIVTCTPHRPCSKLAQRTTATKKAALTPGRLRGILLDALQPAVITLGDPAERILADMGNTAR
jgi:MOSC domain-containing protein YiiM